MASTKRVAVTPASLILDIDGVLLGHDRRTCEVVLAAHAETMSGREIPFTTRGAVGFSEALLLDVLLSMPVDVLLVVAGASHGIADEFEGT